MRFLIRFTLVLSLIAPAAIAKDLYLPVAGSPGIFRTDVRLLNPSNDKDIVVNASFLPSGRENLGAPTHAINVPKRNMINLNDAVRDTLGVTDPNAVGAIKFSSSDNFVASARIYVETVAPVEGTLGQFVPALDASEAKTKGVLIQLKSNGTFGQSKTYRSNVGFMNPGNTTATVTVRFYDRNNLLIGQPLVRNVPAMSVDMVLAKDFPEGDFSDAWVSFESTQAVFGFASVIDNGTADPFFEIAFADSPTPAPNPQTKIFNITASDGAFTVAEGPLRVRQGDHVVLRITAQDTAHGIAIDRYRVVELALPRGVQQTLEFDANVAGNFPYFCTRVGCSPGHVTMTGTLVVTGANEEPNGPPY